MKNVGFNAIHVAIIDDHPAIREAIIARMSTMQQFQLSIEAENGKDFIEKLESHPKHLPDLCILDIKMPVMNGWEVMEHVGQKMDMSFLIFSDSDNEQHIQKAIQLGARGYLHKSTSTQTLLHAALGIAQGSTFFAPYNAKEIKRIKEQPHKPIKFTEKEMQYFSLCCTHLTHKEMAEKLGWSLRSVEGVRDNLFKKLMVRSRLMIALYAIDSGICGTLSIHG